MERILLVVRYVEVGGVGLGGNGVGLGEVIGFRWWEVVVRAVWLIYISGANTHSGDVRRMHGYW